MSTFRWITVPTAPTAALENGRETPLAMSWGVGYRDGDIKVIVDGLTAQQSVAICRAHNLALLALSGESA